MSTENQKPQDQQDPKAQKPQEGASPDSVSEEEKREEAKLPDLYQKSLQRVRREAALYRTKLRDSEKLNDELIEAEMAKVPENLRHLIPAGPRVAQLTWVREAGAAGLFKGPEAAAPRVPSTTTVAPSVSGGAPPQPLTARERQELGSPGISHARKQELLAKRDAYRRSQG